MTAGSLMESITQSKVNITDTGQLGIVDGEVKEFSMPCRFTLYTGRSEEAVCFVSVNFLRSKHLNGFALPLPRAIESLASKLETCCVGSNVSKVLIKDGMHS